MRPTYALIDKEKLKNNITILRDKAGDRIFMAIIKANAYGHGDIEMLNTLYDMGIRHFGVATFYEALRLREAKSDIYVFIIGATNHEDYSLAYKKNIAIAIHNIYDLEYFLSLDNKPKAHLKIDTGMRRIGFNYNNIVDVIDTIKDVEFDGIYTHIARADESSFDSAELQIKRFKAVVDICKDNGMNFDFVHYANSATTLYFDLSYSNMVRCGIAMYGFDPSEHNKYINLKPILSLYSKIVAIREIEAGEGVGYGHKFVADKKTKIATAPIGYADGYRRCMSGKAKVFVNGSICNVVGNITMDQIMIDITDVDAKVGTDVEIIGENITANDLANLSNTINYEILTGIQERVNRKYI